MKKGYITLNYLEGWKVVIDKNNHVDATKPIFNSCLLDNVGLEMCKQFCNNNTIQIIRICK